MKIYLKIILCFLLLCLILVFPYNEITTAPKQPNASLESEVSPLPPDIPIKPLAPVDSKEADKNNKNKIFLTFDDGPSSNITPKILDLLYKYDVKATFFILNYKDNKKDIINRIIDEGHTLAIHGFSHDYQTIYASSSNCLENFIKLQSKLQNDFDVFCNIVRFPGGSSNTVSKKYCANVITNSLPKLKQSELIYFDWNISSGDAGLTTDPNEVFKNVVNYLKPERNNVVLMHDSSSKEHTYLALENIILYAFKNNYCFEKITANTPPIHHKIYN